MKLVPNARVRTPDGNGKYEGFYEKRGKHEVSLDDDPEYHHHYYSINEIEVIKQPTTYVWTFAMGENVGWSGETHDRIERRIATYTVSDDDRAEIVAWMNDVEQHCTDPTFCQFHAFGTVLFYFPEGL